MREKMTLTEAFIKVLNIEIKRKDLEKHIFDKNFLSSISMEQLSYIAKNTFSNKISMSAFIHSVFHRPIELANSELLDKVCDEYSLIRDIGKDRIKNALLNGKNKEILNYLYTDLPKKVIQEKIDFHSKQETKDAYKNKVSAFVIPTKKTLKNITEALCVSNFIHEYYRYLNHEDADNYEDFIDMDAENILKDIDGFILYPQTNEGYLYQAEIIKLNFEYSNRSFWQDVFKLEKCEFHADTNDNLLNKHLTEVFNLHNLSSDEKINFYHKMVVEEHPKMTPETIIYDNCTDQILEIVKNCQERDSQNTVYQICAGYVNNFFHRNEYNEAMNLINNETFKKLVIKFNDNIDIEKIYEYNDLEVFKLLFSQCHLNESCIVYFDNENILEDLKPLLEKEELKLQLSNF